MKEMWAFYFRGFVHSLRISIIPSEMIWKRSRLLAVLLTFLIGLLYYIMYYPKGGMMQYSHDGTVYGGSDFFINCADIHKIRTIQKLGNGVCKQGFLGEYKGTRVVVKMATVDQKKLSQCLEMKDKVSSSDLWNLCYTYCTKNVMKDILLHKQLSHPNIIKLVGYCIRGDELNSTSILTHGAISIFQYGDRVTSSSLRSAPWTDRLKYASEIASLMAYFAESPIGSLSYPDLKLGHFVKVGSSLKLIDMDSISGKEPRCDASKPCRYKFPCTSGGCVGTNAYTNLMSMYRVLFSEVLSVHNGIPSNIEQAVMETKRKVQHGKMNSSVFTVELQKIRNILLSS